MADDAPPKPASPPQPSSLPQNVQDRLSDPNYIRTQEYKKRVVERYNPPKPMTTRENVVLLPDGTAQATGPSQDATKNDFTALDVAKTLRPEDLLELHRVPCVRDSQLWGIGGGALMGAARRIWGSPVGKSANWAVGTWAIVSLGLYEYCRFNRQREKDGVQKAVEIMREKSEERREKAKQARLQAQQEAAQKQRLEEEAKRKWWGLGRFKFW